MPLYQHQTQFHIDGPPKTPIAKLPVGVYSLRFNQMMGYFLQKVQDFKLPAKLYGDFSDTKIWKKSFETFDRNVGILLSGLKGTGKTIEAKKFCIESGRPIILIEHGYNDPSFISFLASPELEGSVILIDEYEKHFGESEILLSLLDGVYPTKLAFVLTVNTDRISEYLINRLGRIKYRKTYTNLTDEIVREVVEDSLVYKEHAETISAFFDTLGICTFDLLTTMIAEINLLNQDAFTCGARFNVRSTKQDYELVEYINGVPVSEPATWYGNIQNFFTLAPGKTYNFEYYRTWLKYHLFKLDYNTAQEKSSEKSTKTTKTKLGKVGRVLDSIRDDFNPVEDSVLIAYLQSRPEFKPALDFNEKLKAEGMEDDNLINLESGYSYHQVASDMVKITKNGSIVITKVSVPGFTYQLILTKKKYKPVSYGSYVYV